jgi:hypothetical protein
MIARYSPTIGIAAVLSCRAEDVIMLRDALLVLNPDNDEALDLQDHLVQALTDTIEGLDA